MNDKHHIAAINFEAGDHAMPQDPLEIELALRAAKVAWEKFPYLVHRYGERGKRCTDSDSCWLVTLARNPRQVTVTKLLEWLRTVLASRGIPTVILESHLQAISAELARLGMKTQFDPFLSDRDAERCELFGAESRSRLTDAFDQRFRACAGFKVESAAELITSAWVDKHAGISDAIPGLRDWFTDAGRFSPDWTASVHELLVELDRVYGPAL